MTTTRRKMEYEEYIRHWRTRGERVATYMGWRLVGCDPDFGFVRPDHTTVHLPVDVVQAMCRLIGEYRGSPC